MNSNEHPVVSVLVIAWRLEDELIEAISSLASSTDAPDFEVIVVSNGAPSGLLQRLGATFEGLRVLDLGYNTGYGFACNRGAEEARGEFVLFFNDDAVASPTMMRALVDSIQQPIEPDRVIAAVGAVLVNSNGTIQEAGSRLLESGGTVQLAAGSEWGDAAARGILDRRSVDYASGAALLVRRGLFLELGGYDARYRPAYFEDVDLALRLRVMGFDVVFEPKAVATHISGASTGADSRFRQFAGEHAGREFVERWRDLLPAAATADDPVNQIVQISDDVAVPEVPPREDESPCDVALGIASDYSGWLNSQLEHSEAHNAQCRSEHHALEVRLASLRADVAAAEELAQQRGELADQFFRRLDDLEHRGIIGIAKWRIDVYRNRLRGSA